jgi:hypothetical protein
MPEERDPSEIPIVMTSVARGINPGEMLYTLETDEISGVFTRDAGGIETRLFHTADFRVRHLDAHPAGAEVAASIYHRNGMANLAVLKTNGSDLTEVTEGESVDLAPRWAPGPERRLVFQSAGMARDSRARLSGVGPFAIQLLHLDSGEVSCLAEDPKFDFLWPRMGADGTLYYIRRPSHNAPQPPEPWVPLLATLLVPVRILWAIGKLIELFVERRTGQPLFTVKDVAEKDVATPASWLLMRQKAAEVETIAEGALSFDIAHDGAVIYSNGSAVFRVPANGGPAVKILSGAGIDLIAAL